MKTKLTLLAVSVALAFTGQIVSAATITWNPGTTGDWGTSSNWDSNSVPALNGPTPDIVNINDGAVTYSGTSGDWADNTTVTISGSTASWVQTTGNWLKIGDGSGNTGTLNLLNGGSFDVSPAGNTFIGNGGTGILLVDGGTFTAQTLNIGGGSSVTINNNGTVTTTSDIHNSGTINLAGGQANIAGEFKLQSPGLQGTINGGSVQANLLSFIGDGTTVIDFLAGNITLNNGTFFDGIYSTGGYINFSPTSTGTVVLLNGATEANANNLINNSARLRVDNLVSPSSFVITPIENGVAISLAAIPEPASLGLLTLGVVTLLTRRRKA